MKRLLRPYLVVVVFALLVLLVSPSASSAATTAAQMDRAGGSRERILVTLQADGLPSPDGVTTLTLTATPLVDAPDLRVRWLVPEDVELLGDAEESLGPVAARQMVSVERQVRFPAGGPFKLVAEAYYEPLAEMRLAASGVLFFTVGRFDSQITTSDPTQRRPDAALMPSTLEQVDEAAVRAPNGDPCVTVRGRITRIERSPIQSGFAADQTVPVHNALVEIREDDTIFDDSYGEGLTDENGDYAFSFCDDDGFLGGELEVYIRLHAQVKAQNGDSISYVEDSSWLDEKYEFNTANINTDGGNFIRDISLDEFQSAVMNINDAIFDAWTFWNASGGDHDGDSRFDHEAEVHYEPGYGDTGSYYVSFWDEITIADDPSNPDMWDDSVIIHEWGHMADDKYGCDDNPGGQHFIGQLADDEELTWGEGYPDYWQSAVRAATGQPSASFYLDINGAGSAGIAVNLENTQTGLTSVFYEMAIAAALWDLNDPVNDGNDMVAHGQTVIQDVYTTDDFAEDTGGFFDANCTFDEYLESWVDTGKPADAVTAAAIRQNVGVTTAFGLAQQASQRSPSAVNTPLEPGASPLKSKWWNEVVWIVDNSPSMASAKLNAVKTVLGEQINDLTAEPEGTEFGLETFNNADGTNNVVLAGQFFEGPVQQGVTSLAPIGGSDPSCTVDALDALKQAVEGRAELDAWLFTDSNTSTNPSVENMRQLLTDRQVRASFALLASCTPVAAATNADLTVEEAEAAALLQNAAQAYLGGGAEEPPANIVPYLLTAIQSGGQFLYSNATNVDDIADILRAQLTHSAGAGRWSDYVSDEATYRYDELASWEYGWIEAHTSEGGTAHGQPDGSFVQVDLPEPFTYYNRLPSGGVRVFEDGHLTFNSFPGGGGANTTLPSAEAPLRALFPMWDDLGYIVICRPEEAAAPDGCGLPSGIYSRLSDDGEWFVIEWYNYYSEGGSFSKFQVLLNAETGEIRYQYHPTDVTANYASSATIGLQDTPTNGLQVTYNDVNGATAGMGYKFTPAPPQPTKTYTVSVDSLMEGVGFLLTGYSGDFEPLVVRDPDGNAIACDSPGTICLNLGLVQYVQVNVNNRVGDWHAEVDAGPSGGGTFGFTSFATSPVAVRGAGDHSLPLGIHAIQVDFGQPLDGNVATGFFQLPNGSPFGGNFPLFDDGAHGDGSPGDGLFGTLAFEPTVAGTAYLGGMGTLGGVEFTRVDPVPYSFQPLSVTPPEGEQVNNGALTTLQFGVTNQDEFDHCYIGTAQAPAGWGAGQLSPTFCLDAGETMTRTVIVSLGGLPNTAPSGTDGVVTFAVQETEQGLITGSASAIVTRRRPPAEIRIENPTLYLRPNGDIAPLTVSVLDATGYPVADGTEVQLIATLGIISPTVGLTQAGQFYAEFISGPAEGEAVVTATTTGPVTATTFIDIAAPRPNQIALELGDATLPADETSTTTVTATVRDRYGNPVAGQTVRIGVSGDGAVDEEDDPNGQHDYFGTINGEEGVTGTTNAQGQFTATFTSGNRSGTVTIVAELLVAEGSTQNVVHETHATLSLSQVIRSLYLPLVGR